MHRPVLILTAAMSLASSVLIRASDDLVLDRFARYLDSLRTQAGIPGLAAAIIGSNSVMWERAFGRQNIDRSEFVRTDTPFHLDGGMQILTATLVLQCAEEGRFDLNDRLDRIKPDIPECGATVSQLLSHTSAQSGGLVFSYRPERLNALAQVVSVCRSESFRRSVADLLNQRGMYNSVPGPDAVTLSTASGFDQSEVDRYEGVMNRLATGYTVSAQGAAAVASYSATTLRPWEGLITTVGDFAKFDLALKKPPLLLRSESLVPADPSISAAWQAPTGRDGRRLPHGLGWFVQNYNGVDVVWQFGSGNASSSMVVTVPSRGLTMILLANSSGLAKGFNLAAGDISVSPFAKVFLGTFIR
jgi:CubicO group peptidase (beta-lactamase class C family)